MTQTNLPVELVPTVTTIEYALPQTLMNRATASIASPTPAQLLNPIFLFVIDVCVEQEELQKLKDSILQSLELLPSNAQIGLITFGTTVQVYDLSFKSCIKSVVFRGTHEPDAIKVSQTLGLGVPIAGSSAAGGIPKHHGKNPYLVSLEESEDTIQTVLEQLHRDPTPVKNDKRPLRATGVAVSVAISLMEHTACGGRIMVFMGGACTQGPGLIVSSELREPLRSHHDLNKEKAPHVGPSIKFFRGLAQRAASNGHAVDLLSCSLDQTGLLEMKSLCKMTGGIMIMADAFDAEVFQRSFLKMFERDGSAPGNGTAPGGLLQMGLNATIQVVTSPELKIQGGIGHMFSLNQKTSSNVSDKEIGIGGTNIWRCCALDPNTSFAFFFEVTGTQQRAQSAGHSRNGMVQFLTVYQHANGHNVLRVTTLAHAWAQSGNGMDHRALIPGFDQEAAAALIARLAVFKSEHEESNPIRWLDRQLITMLNRYALFRKGEPSSLTIPNEMNIFHQFMFYLRRGPLIQVFNNSPDETVFFRYYLQRESTSNVLIMIQPTLESYTLDSDPVPVLLSAASVTKDNVLLLDTFFHIIIHYGSTIAKWAEAGYHQNEEYENLAELLETPKADAAQLIADRMPMPMYVVCNQNTSQARFLTASVDPTITHTSAQNGSSDGQVVLTEDVNLQVFVDFLHRRVVDFEG
jgi:protein transport protein SEC23